MEIVFTGIIETLGTVSESRVVAGGRRVRIDAGELCETCALGASVCVDGVCLTIAAVAAPSLEFDVVSETLDRSALGAKQPGDKVNLEKSLRTGDRLDGHFVQGHVDGTAMVDRFEASPRGHVIWLRPESHLMACIVPKGSVAVDGVSLTIAEVRKGRFSVALIPTTLERTTLRSLTPGGRVNIETDIIARTVIHHLTEHFGTNRLSFDQLERTGFV